MIYQHGMDNNKTSINKTNDKAKDRLLQGSERTMISKPFSSVTMRAKQASLRNCRLVGEWMDGGGSSSSIRSFVCGLVNVFNGRRDLTLGPPTLNVTKSTTATLNATILYLHQVVRVVDQRSYHSEDAAGLIMHLSNRANQTFFAFNLGFLHNEA